MTSLYRFFLVFCCLNVFSLSAEEEVKDPATGAVFPEKITIEHEGKTYKLDATGVATRKKFMITVYSVAHYLQDTANRKAPDKIAEILNDDYAKQLTLKWQRSIEASKIQEGFHDSFHTVVAKEDQDKFKKEIDQYIAFFNHDINKGDENLIRWLPGGYLEVINNGKQVGSITNKDFAKVVWNIWFGAKSVVKKDNLISLMK